MAKKKRKKKRKLRLSHLVIFAIIVYIMFIFKNQRDLKLELQAKRENVQIEINDLQREIDELNKEIENSDTLQFVEKVARDELGMVKPREIIYIDKNKNRNPFLRIRKNEN